MTPEYFLKIIRRYWALLLIGILLGSGCGYLYGSFQPKVYTANSSGFIVSTAALNNVGDTSIAVASATDAYAKSRAQSFADLGQSRVVAEQVIADLGLSTSPEALVSRIQVSVPPNTVTMQVKASAGSPEDASKLANAWMQAMAEQIRVLEAGGDGTGAATVELTPVETANIPSSPTSPNLMLFASVGGLLGLFLAFAFSAFKNQYDKRIRSVDDVQALTEHPIVGKIPMEKSLTDQESRLAPDQEASLDVRVRTSTTFLGEALRELRTNLEFLDVDHPPRSIVVTSALPGDGKSTIAAYLATMIASSGKQVVLIDGDLRKPTVASTFKIPGEVGLTDVLAGRVDLDAAVQRWSPKYEMFILPSGSIPPNPAELLASNTMEELVQSLTSEGVTVVIDAPPVLPVADASIMSAKFDGALVVASAGLTRTDSLEQALNRIEVVHGRVLGLVLNRIPTKGIDKNAYGYYGNTYYYQQDDKDRKRKASAKRLSQRAGK